MLARAFFDGTLLSLYDRRSRASHFQRNSSRAVAVAGGGSRVAQQYDAGGRGNTFSAGKTFASFFEATGRSRLAAAAIARLSCPWRLPFMKNKKDRQSDTAESRGVIPFYFLAEIEDGENGEYRQSDDFLNGL
jgi:hypothetical protein